MTILIGADTLKYCEIALPENKMASTTNSKVLQVNYS